ncbi:hypothetical protein LZC95_49070 [Pendulispora brunnea]|uniref:Transmembrane protein n=1 Tax=Pendulispora brunnea TaxID=2905690 RepID=A0ABZ2KDD0_9BACT
MNHSRRPAWFAYLCALLALAFCASSSAGALAMAGAVWTSAGPVVNVANTANADPVVDVPAEGEGDAADAAMAVPAMVEEEEEREDDPVPGAEQRLVELSARLGRLVAWDRPDFVRPVKDPVDETASPPPRA